MSQPTTVTVPDTIESIVLDTGIGGRIASLVREDLEYKNFSTGSKGFHVTGKVVVNGERYQVQASAILVGSKGDPSVTCSAGVADARITVALFAEQELAPKTFSSGKTGFYASGKKTILGQKYQVAVQAVKLAG